ncbi:hypothetical protein CI102_10127 [Trichoderma harzianum]|nr:hypothetical protein CI102_10127 [Trichoderma harzianum]
MASQMKIERMIHEEGSGVNFGAHISNVDLESASAQYEFTERLNSAASMGHGNKHNPKRFLLSPDLNTVPHQPQVQIIGNGFVPEHQGAKNLRLQYPHHRSSHPTTIADEDDVEFTRFYRWHIDAALYDDAPPVATTILAVTLPKRRMQTVRYDDGTGDELSVPLGTIAFAKDKAFVRSTRVEYAAHPYIWMGRAKSHPTGLGLISEGKELDDEQLPPVDPTSIQILPMCWRNPVTNRLALQVHAAVARRLHLANGEVIDDLERVRDILYRLQRPGIAPQLVYAHDWEEGDFVIFHNRGLQHSIVGSLAEDEVRIMRQCIIAGTEMPEGPEEVVL